MNLVIFNFNKVNVRTTVDENSEVWFVAADVAAALRYSEVKDMTRNFGGEEKRMVMVPTFGGSKKMTIINEYGLYQLALNSRKPEAKAFRKWLTGVVLPAIHNTDRYTTDSKTSKIPFGEAAAGLAIIYRSLNVPESEKLSLFHVLAEDYGVSANCLPTYTIGSK